MFNPEGKFFAISGVDEIDGEPTPDRGYLMGANGNEGSYFDFADPVNDVKGLENGSLKGVVRVTDNDVKEMMYESGIVDHKSAGTLNPFNAKNIDSAKYMIEQGSQKLDFAKNSLPQRFPGTSSNPLMADQALVEGSASEVQSSNLFLEPGGEMAHNPMNFGNWLVGVAAATAGVADNVNLGKSIVKGAANWNSNRGYDYNGYDACNDSADDQLSLGRGHDYGVSQGYFKNLEPKPKDEE